MHAAENLPRSSYFCGSGRAAPTSMLRACLVVPAIFIGAARYSIATRCQQQHIPPSTGLDFAAGVPLHRPSDLAAGVMLLQQTPDSVAGQWCGTNHQPISGPWPPLGSWCWISVGCAPNCAAMPPASTLCLPHPLLQGSRGASLPLLLPSAMVGKAATSVWVHPLLGRFNSQALLILAVREFPCFPSNVNTLFFTGFFRLHVLAVKYCRGTSCQYSAHECLLLWYHVHTLLAIDPQLGHALSELRLASCAQQLDFSLGPARAGRPAFLQWRDALLLCATPATGCVSTEVRLHLFTKML
jgi:hypothetical protein